MADREILIEDGLLAVFVEEDETLVPYLETYIGNVGPSLAEE